MTAVEHFWNKVVFKLSLEQANDFLPLFEQAKEIEKQQIIDAYTDGRLSVISREIISYEQYYNETFKTR
jgi:hypothetical protein